MSELQSVARRWLLLAEQLGWGVEGPADAGPVLQAIQALAGGRDASEPGVVLEERDLGLRPVDALFQAAQLLVEASLTSGSHRQAELVSSARGWLALASRR